MTKLERIEREVANLSVDELTQFREWFAAHDADAFDARLERAAGRLDALAETALAAHRDGKTRAL